jgi:hypothetical protein
MSERDTRREPPHSLATKRGGEPWQEIVSRLLDELGLEEHEQLPRESRLGRHACVTRSCS